MKLRTILFLVLTSLSSWAQSNYTPSAQNLATRAWFQEAKFGLFIHWGLSSMLGQGEWVMNNRNIQVNDYKRLQNAFYPHAFQAEEWVLLAKNAGMKYITIITRHHDGFSLWDTQFSDWKITNTPYKKDVLKELTDACRKHGLKVYFYYSLLDWYRTDYQYETGKTGKGTGRTQPSNWPSYIQFMKNQLTELLTKYGEVSGIWFDGHWDQLDNDHDKSLQSKVDWKYDEIYALIHQLQPGAMIGNNHHLLPLPGEDFQMFEKDLPGGNTTGFGGQAISTLPLETCETINGAWGYNITDRSYKSTPALIQYLVKAAGFGSNFLLNVGPMPDGQIQVEFKERLQAMGEWLKTYGATAYGTKAGPLAPTEERSITQKGNTVYLHILKPTKTLTLELPFTVKSAKTFLGAKAVPFEKTKVGNLHVFDVSQVPFDGIDAVVVIEK